MSPTPTADDYGSGPALVLLAGPPLGEPLARLWRNTPAGWETLRRPAALFAELVAAFEQQTGYRWDDPPPVAVSEQACSQPGEPLKQAATALLVELASQRGELLCSYAPALFVLPLLAARTDVTLGLEVLSPSETKWATDRAIGWSEETSLAIWERYLATGLRLLESLPGSLVTRDRRDGGDRAKALGLNSLPAGLLAHFESARQESDDSVLSPARTSQDELYRLLVSRSATGEPWRPRLEPVESPASAELLSLRHSARELARQWRAPTKPPAGAGSADEERFPLDATEDTGRYHAWLEKRGEGTRISLSSPVRQKRRKAPSSPGFSVVLTGPEATGDQLASLLEQTFDSFEVVMSSATGRGEIGKDRRFSVAGASFRPKGRYVVLVAPGYLLSPNCLQSLWSALHTKPARLAYCDEDSVDETGTRQRPIFKPGWSPDFALATPYLGGLVILEAELYSELAAQQDALDASAVHALLLRAAERFEAGEVVAVPEVLCHRQLQSGDESSVLPMGFPATEGAIAAALSRRGEAAKVEPHPLVKGAFSLVRQPRERHLVSLIVPFRDEPALLASCYRSITSAPGDVGFELLLVDNGSVLPETGATLNELRRDRRVRYLEAPGPFNWSTINNDAASQALGEQLLFLNNDVEALAGNWLAQLVAMAERPDVGAVGARLLYPDRTLQHAGLSVGVGFGALHDQQGLAARAPGYLGRPQLAHECSAVTGACLITRRQVFESVGGFDAQLPTAFGDVDYCLRVRRGGLRVLYEPVAELVHHESKSRGRSGEAEGVELFRGRWRQLLYAGDPYYNANLGRFDPYCRLPGPDEEASWETFCQLLGLS